MGTFHCANASFFEKGEQMPEAFLFQFVLRDKAQRSRVDAVTETGGLRAVGKDMAKVGIAGFGTRFDPYHSVARVFHLNDFLFLDWLVKAGPTGATIKFGFRGKERFAGDDIHVDAFLFVVPVGVVERGFSAAFAGNLVLHGGELIAEFFFVI